MVFMNNEIFCPNSTFMLIYLEETTTDSATSTRARVKVTTLLKVHNPQVTIFPPVTNSGFAKSAYPNTILDQPHAISKRLPRDYPVMVSESR
jgi:hypothetical protein